MVEWDNSTLTGPTVHNSSETNRNVMLFTSYKLEIRLVNEIKLQEIRYNEFTQRGNFLYN